MSGTYSRQEKKHIAGMSATILVLIVVGWGGLLLMTVFGHVPADAGFGLGVGWVVFTLGMRHAFDADHIAAIDNTTRSLVAAGQRPLSVGFWFSLGHTTIVFVACALLTAGVRLVATTVTGASSALRTGFGVIGTSVSAVFLLIIGVMNLVALVGLVSVFRTSRRNGQMDHDQMDAHLNQRGLISRLFRGRFSRIAKPWQIYPVGLLFGLGFDTATEVGLFVIAGGATVLQVPWYASLTLPVIFAAGMVMFDTFDGLLTSYTYSWASAVSVWRRLVYNIVLTALSVGMALLIGVVEATSVLSQNLHVKSRVIDAIGDLNLNYLGFGAAAAFVLAWGVSFFLLRRPAEPVETNDTRH